MMDAIYANSSARTVVKNVFLGNVIDVNLAGNCKLLYVHRYVEMESE